MIKFSYSSSLIALSLVLSLASFDLGAAGRKKGGSRDGASSSTSVVAAKSPVLPKSESDISQGIKPVQREWLPDDLLGLDPFSKLSKEEMLRSLFTGDIKKFLQDLDSYKDVVIGDIKTARDVVRSQKFTDDVVRRTNGLSEELYSHLVFLFNICEYSSSQLKLDVGQTLKAVTTNPFVMDTVMEFQEFNRFKPQIIHNIIQYNLGLNINPFEKIKLLGAVLDLMRDIMGTEFERDLYTTLPQDYTVYIAIERAGIDFGRPLAGLPEIVYASTMQFLQLIIRSGKEEYLKLFQGRMSKLENEILSSLVNSEKIAHGQSKTDLEAQIILNRARLASILEEWANTPGSSQDISSAFKFGFVKGLEEETLRINARLEALKTQAKEVLKKKKKKKQDDERQWVPDADVQIPPHINISLNVVEDLLKKKTWSKSDTETLTKTLNGLRNKFYEIFGKTSQLAFDAEKAGSSLPGNGMSRKLYKTLNRYFRLLDLIEKKAPGLCQQALEKLLSTTYFSYAFYHFPEFNKYKPILINWLAYMLRDEPLTEYEKYALFEQMANMYEDLVGTEFEKDLPFFDHFQLMNSKIFQPEMFGKNSQVTYHIAKKFIFAFTQILINQKKYVELGNLISDLEERDRYVLKRIIELDAQKNERLNLDEVPLTELKRELGELSSLMEEFRVHVSENISFGGSTIREIAKIVDVRLMKEFFLRLGEKTIADLQAKIVVREEELETQKAIAMSVAVEAPEILTETSKRKKKKAASQTESVVSTVPASDAPAPVEPAAPLVELPSATIAAAVEVAPDSAETSSVGSQGSVGSESSVGKPRLKRTTSYKEHKAQQDQTRALARREKWQASHSGNQGSSVIGTTAHIISQAAEKTFGKRVGKLIAKAAKKLEGKPRASTASSSSQEFEIARERSFTKSLSKLDALTDVFLDKLNEKIEFMQLHPYEAHFDDNPEQLEGNLGVWSRRLNQQYRLIYRLEDNKIVLMGISKHKY